jgi:glycogen(starch) synthase
MMAVPLQPSVSVPENAGAAVRAALGLPPDAPLRIAYVAGPGDACGTFDHWSQGYEDTRTPVVAYSAQFYTLVDRLDAKALVLVEQDKQPARPDPRFRFVHTPHPRGRRGLGYRIDNLAFARAVWRALRDWRPDVIVVGSDAPDILILGLPRARRIVLTVHNSIWPMGRRPRSPKARLVMAMRAFAFRRADTAVNTSQECADQVAALGGPSGSCSFAEIPQVLAAHIVATAPRPDAHGARRLLFLGRIEANKGVFDLLAAFATVAADHPALTLDIAGTGSADAALRAEIARLPVADRIHFHGLCDANGVHDLLDRSDLLICPTRSSFLEGLALVVVEAAAHGIPTLLSSVIPARALFPGGCVVFPADETAALIQNLRALVNDPDLYGRLRSTLATQVSQLHDPAKSWGSCLFGALSVPTDR